MSQTAPIPRHALVSPNGPPLRLVPLTSYLRHNVDYVHRHDFYELLWIRRGRGTHEVDFVAYPLQNQQVVLLAPHQVHYLRAADAHIDDALILIFNEEFLGRDAADRDLLHGLARPTAALTDLPLALAATLTLLEDQYRRPSRDYDVLGAALRLVLLLMRQHQPPAAPAARPGGLAAQRLLAFQALLETEHSRWHQVAPYAARLALSPKRLDQICRAALGQSARRLVHVRLALEAKRRLAYEPTSVKEIAFALGFEDPSYFSRFFRAQTGVTPQMFRARFPDSTRR